MAGISGSTSSSTIQWNATATTIDVAITVGPIRTAALREPALEAEAM
jgi:hypothetical protein